MDFDDELVVDRTDACFDYDYDTDDEWVVEADIPAYRLYVEDFKKSKGFDIDHYFVRGGLLPFDLDRDDGSYVFRDLKPSVEAAIGYQNAKKNWNLELVKITKCNYSIGSHYYATFDAIDRDAGFIRTFQAELIRDHFSGQTEIYRFRVKPDSAPQPIK